MDMREKTKLLNQITIVEVARYLGVTLPKQGSISCPLPDHEDSNPSFSVFAGGSRWKCYGCNRSGGAIDLVKEFLGVSFIDAKKWLGEASGFTDEMPMQRKHQQPTRIDSAQNSVKGKRSFPEPEILQEIYDLLVLSHKVKQYMVSRGFSDDVINQSGVVEFRPRSNAMGLLVEKYGFEGVQSTGLMSKQSTLDDQRFTFPMGSALFPFFREGVIVNFQVRLLGNNKHLGKWRNLNTVSRSIYNYDVLLDRSIQSIYICEGVTDTLSAMQFGLSAIGILGVSTDFTDFEYSLLQGRAVYLLTDWDIAGEKKALELSALFKARGIMSIRKKRPSKTATDLNEYLVETSK